MNTLRLEECEDICCIDYFTTAFISLVKGKDVFLGFFLIQMFLLMKNMKKRSRKFKTKTHLKMDFHPNFLLPDYHSGSSSLV